MAPQFKRTKVENEVEKDILTGAIVSDLFLEETHKILKNLHLIREPSVRKVILWCTEYYKEFGRAPKELIHDVFRSRQRELDEDTSDTIYQILTHVNDRYIENPDTFSEQYYVSKAKKYIEEQSLIQLADEIKGHIATGNVEQAKHALIDYNKIDPVVSLGTKPFRDVSFIHSIFASMKKGLVEFPYDALQALLKDVYRGDVLSVAGPAKRGKSFLMFQLGYYALYNNLNVAVFSYEMDREVMGMRLFQNLMGETRNEEAQLPVPYFDKDNNIQYEYADKEGLDLQESIKFQDAFSKFGKTGELYFFDHNSCGRKVSDIADALDRIEKYDETKIDVVVIDYDKLLENEYGFRGATHESLDQIWKDVKAKIAQDRNTWVIFGSQYNKTGAKYEVGPQEASGSSRKFDYASHWVSILQSEAEKRAGIMRLSVLGRHDGFFQSDKVVCLQSLAMARPILDARWMRDIGNYEDIVGAQQEVVEEGMKSEEQEGATKNGGKKWGFGQDA